MALAKYNDSVSSLNKDTIKYFLVNGNWNELKLTQQVPTLMIPMILDTKFQYQQGSNDKAIWKPTDSGKFSYASAWNVYRAKGNIEHINSLILHKHVPFKMSFLLWRALSFKLPTNETLAVFGIELVRCYCCRNNG